MNQVKDFFEYIFNSFKIWVIVQPWEAGIRVRKGKTVKKLEKGMYFKIPYLDSVYVQETRLRVVKLPLQTLTTKDNQTLTISGSIGLSINDVEKVYNTLYLPETTIRNIAQSELSTLICSQLAASITLELIETSILKTLHTLDYGFDFDYFKVSNFAFVRTYRLIQDNDWSNEGFDISKKR